MAGAEARADQAGIEQAVIDSLRSLPLEQQREVLDFVEFLRQRKAGTRPRRSLEGLWGDLGIDVTPADIAEARREMWGNFPRDLLNNGD